MPPLARSESWHMAMTDKLLFALKVVACYLFVSLASIALIFTAALYPIHTAIFVLLLIALAGLLLAADIQRMIWQKRGLTMREGLQSTLRLLRRRLRQFRSQKQSCPRRMREIGPWQKEEGLDWWEQVGPDRVCSFCGSMHPEEFFAFLERVLEDDDPRVRVGRCDKDYKVYVHRPEIENATEGAIKFYKQHLNILSAEEIDRWERPFKRAMKRSWEKLGIFIEEAV